ncbi:MAG: hypothetical protein M4579_002373 [Chaenotheca gracillima]|nr:MAG: hypothetical protein M4579_002373 [Chaenotheca gracillima]
MSVPKARLLDLLKVQCRIFSTTFNPERLRMGNKVLRQRLRGPALVDYYPKRVGTYKDLTRAYPEFETWDDDEEERLEDIQVAKARGKGRPKKKTTKDEAAWPSSDSLTYSGGFHNLKCDPAAEYPSSITPNGTVRWSQSRLDDDSGLHHAIDKDSTRARGTLEVGFPNVDWSALQAVYGWAALQYQAWARGTLFVSTQGSKGKTALVPVALYSDQVLELWIDDTPHFGGDFYSSRRAPLVLWLTPGSHLLELRLIRDVRSMGGAWRVEPVIKVTLEARELRGPNAGAPLLGIADDGDGIRSSVLPDLLEDIGRVSSNLGSVALRNDHLEWISVWDISSTDSPSADIFCFVEDVFEISLLQRLGPIRLAPGQTRPVPFAIKLKKKNDFRSNSLPTLSIIIEFAIGDVDGEEQNNERLNAVHTFTLRKVTSMYEPHKITFLHPSGIVSYAVLRPPAQNATCAHAPKRDDAEKIPILLNLHGAGLEADSPQVAHTLDPLPRLCAWALFPTGVTPWSSDDWHNWGFADVEAAIAAIPTWTENADWNGPAADLDRWLVSGHSNGGQGVWFALTHRPDKIIAATPVSGYLSIDAYVPYTLRMEMDPSMTHNLRAALNDYKHEMLVENVAGIPILQQHGSGDDNVPVYHSRRMHELIGRTGIHSEYFELDGAPHWFDGVMTTNRLSAFYEKHLDGAFTISQVPEQFAIMIANPGSMGSKGGIVVDQLMSPDQYVLESLELASKADESF